MPQLSRKNLVKSKKAPISLKSPATEENTEKVLDDDKIPNSSNESPFNNDSLSSKSKKKIGKALSIQLSFDLPNSQGQYSDISYRMNEPGIKEAYIDFVTSLSQSIMTDKICSTPLLIGNNESMDLFSPSQLTPLHNMPLIEDENRVLSQDGIQQSSAGDSGFSLTQKILNISDIEIEGLNFMKNFKEPAKKKRSEKSILRKESKYIESEPSLKKREQIETAGSKVSKTDDVSKERGTKKDATEKQKNKRVRKENPEHAEEQEMSLYDRMLLIQESRNVGLYSICDTCDKHRYLPDVKDPLDLPEKWYCHMNPDPDHNKCSDPEEPLVDEEYLIENLYNAGSIVWAKAEGWPWWPAMVEDDPDTEEYYYLENDMKPTMYHVTFFDSCEVTRAWLRPPSLKPFKINMTNPEFQIPKSRKLKLRLEFAVKQAKDALNLSSIDRLKKYSFIQRNAKPLKDIVVKNKSSKKTSKSQKRDSDGIYLAKKKRICRKILSTNSKTDTILNNMNLENDQINLNIIENFI